MPPPSTRLRTAVVLSFALLIGAVFAASDNQYYDNHTPVVGPDGVSRWAGIIKHYNPQKRNTPSNGEDYHRLSYAAKLKPNVVRLDSVNFISSIQCSQGQRVLTVQLKDGAEFPSNWTQGVVLIGDKSWGCVSSDVAELPVGIAVIIESSHSDARKSGVYVIDGKQATLQDIYEVLSVTLDPLEVIHARSEEKSPLRLISMSSAPQSTPARTPVNVSFGTRMSSL